MTPLISVCIPTYNGEEYLKDTLESLRHQTYKNIELIISDDNSNDTTLEIVLEFKKSVNFTVTILNHIPGGIGENWNNCIRNAKGEYIKFLFQDDTLEPNCIEVMYNYLKVTNEKIIVCKRNLIIHEVYRNNIEIIKWVEVFSDLQQKINIKNKDGYSIITKNLFSSTNFLSSPLNKIGEPIVGLIHKSVYERIGLYNKDLKQILDYEFWYRCLLKYNIVLLEDRLVNFRVHPSQTTRINQENNIDEIPEYFRIVEKKYKKYLDKNLRMKLFPSRISKFKDYLKKKIYKWIKF